MAWTFYEHVEADGGGAMARWVADQPQGVRVRLRAKLNAILLELQRSEAPRFTREDGVGQLRGPCRGLFEICLLVDKVQYRPIGCYGPGMRDFTLLVGATERGGELTPESVCWRGLQKKKHIHEKGRIRVLYQLS